MRRNPFLTSLSILLLNGWLLAACTRPQDDKPDNLIPEERMSAILTEIHLAEARVSRMNLGSSDSSNIVYKRLENQIFKTMKVDTSAYTRSYVYYSSHPREMESIYTKIADNLKKKSDKQQKEMHTKTPARS